MQPQITIVSGTRAGEVYALSGEPLVIGRDEGADLALTDPLVSMRHCVVTFTHDTHELQEYGSFGETRLVFLTCASRGAYFCVATDQFGCSMPMKTPAANFANYAN